MVKLEIMQKSKAKWGFFRHFESTKATRALVKQLSPMFGSSYNLQMGE